MPEGAGRAAEALAAAGVDRVLVFGSVVRGDATPRSDIVEVAVDASLGGLGCCICGRGVER